MNTTGAAQDGVFFAFGPAPEGVTARKGQEPAENDFSHYAAYRARPATRTSNSSLTEESVMGIIAWIVLGLTAGLLANLLAPSRRSQDPGAARRRPAGHTGE